MLHPIKPGASVWKRDAPLCIMQTTSTVETHEWTLHNNNTCSSTDTTGARCWRWAPPSLSPLGWTRSESRLEFWLDNWNVNDHDWAPLSLCTDFCPDTRWWIVSSSWDIRPILVQSRWGSPARSDSFWTSPSPRTFDDVNSNGYVSTILQKFVRLDYFKVKDISKVAAEELFVHMCWSRASGALCSGHSLDS